MYQVNLNLRLPSLRLSFKKINHIVFIGFQNKGDQIKDNRPKIKGRKYQNFVISSACKIFG